VKTFLQAILIAISASGLFSTPSAVAQSSHRPHKTVYTKVDRMPELPGGGGSEAIVAAIQQRIVYPPEALSMQIDGRVYVSFTVNASGHIENIVILKGILPACDAAVVKAVQQLPRFIAGRQAGRPVAVLYTVPVSFILQDSAEPIETK
jgi:protein TonB